MGIRLFDHNQAAYDAAVSMLSEAGKAAVIHPTGTGKSFIGFKLCEDNPDKAVCWLSPSAYIFQTQLENLKNAADGYEPKNICFFTYAKLMGMTEGAVQSCRCRHPVEQGQNRPWHEQRRISSCQRKQIITGWLITLFPH